VAKLRDAANAVKPLPRSFMNEEGTGISEAMRRYATPLIRGEAPIRMGADGLPVFMRFRRQMVPRKLASWG
jgi:6-phosphofructokinase 1